MAQDHGEPGGGQWLKTTAGYVTVKWQKEVFSNMEIDTTEPPYVFKRQLYDLTGVPPERQKIVVKCGLLKMMLIGQK
ncbi:ubiquitin carboxyl-terminal hydrolase 7-like isoform X3 [Salvia miltiorrhiza]|uniref:ubiquitin carboxyl-terminal hydrolase 7-like isoform X3 n=1 Tax=Salvia miltiorrhiza TaxID=226208 RepID=UPI0025ABAA57|nr:ubiquitin carboxyl-terminal hydrolase 7-like isoform X3 [Salvia miltiorrhiza]